MSGCGGTRPDTYRLDFGFLRWLGGPCCLFFFVLEVGCLHRQAPVSVALGQIGRVEGQYWKIVSATVEDGIG